MNKTKSVVLISAKKFETEVCGIVEKIQNFRRGNSLKTFHKPFNSRVVKVLRLHK
jgi:hypothetical protein